MARSKSSGRWLDEHFSDQYVKKSQQDGYRSRASYKLLEIQEKDKLFKSGMKVLDLGSAPGGWSQVAQGLVGNKGRVVASDILPMDPIDGVDFVLGDFTEAEVYEQILNVLGEDKILTPGGGLVAKVFHGDGFDELLKTVRSKFNKVQIRKPDASRARSKEQYLVAKGFKG